MNNSSYDLVLHGVVGSGTKAGVNWERPSQWPEIESLVGSNEIVGLYAVKQFPSPYLLPVSFSITCPSGNYTVDWGDGTTDNYASGAVASHYYDYANANLTPTDYGYKCAIIKITATTNITIANFMNASGVLAHNNMTALYSWLDLDINTANLTSLAFPSFKMLKQINVRACAINSMANLFQNMVNLSVLKNFNTSGTISTLNSCFSGCFNLEKIPFLNTSSTTIWTSAFAYCSSLKTIPALDTSAGTFFSNFLLNCSSLEEIPSSFIFTGSPTWSHPLDGLTNLKRFQGTLPDLNNVLPSSNSTAMYSLNGTAIDEVLTNLPSVSGTKNISFAFCVGRNDCTPSIGTAKGWTVAT